MDRLVGGEVNEIKATLDRSQKDNKNILSALLGNVSILVQIVSVFGAFCRHRVISIVRLGRTMNVLNERLD